METKKDPTERSIDQMKELLKGMADQYPTSFICPECKSTVTQQRSWTQRNGWPICCGRTMDDIRA